MISQLWGRFDVLCARLNYSLKIGEICLSLKLFLFISFRKAPFQAVLSGKRIRTGPESLENRELFRLALIISYGHTLATLSLKNEVDVKTLSSTLGHYSKGFTLSTHTYATPEMMREAADTMGNVIGQAI